ncbi:MAG TPA: hypothetical protein VMU76_02225 [Acidimicrobiales bacterium]|nr:hypothetical protein [Acidimicrobiales bacterium]
MSIQAISAGGNESRAPGCARYEETARVDAQVKAATPPGTRPSWAQG